MNSKKDIEQKLKNITKIIEDMESKKTKNFDLDKIIKKSKKNFDNKNYGLEKDKPKIQKMIDNLASLEKKLEIFETKEKFDFKILELLYLDKYLEKILKKISDKKISKKKK